MGLVLDRLSSLDNILTYISYRFYRVLGIART